VDLQVREGKHRDDHQQHRLHGNIDAHVLHLVAQGLARAAKQLRRQRRASELSGGTLATL